MRRPVVRRRKEGVARPEPMRPGVAHRGVGGRAMTIGTVLWFDVPKGYGFLKPDDGGVDGEGPLFAHSRRPLRPCLRDCPFYDTPLRSRDVRLQRRTQPSGEDGHIDLPSRAIGVRLMVSGRPSQIDSKCQEHGPAASRWPWTTLRTKWADRGPLESHRA